MLLRDFRVLMFSGKKSLQRISNSIRIASFQFHSHQDPNISNKRSELTFPRSESTFFKDESDQRRLFPKFSTFSKLHYLRYVWKCHQNHRCICHLSGLHWLTWFRSHESVIPKCMMIISWWMDHIDFCSKVYWSFLGYKLCNLQFFFLSNVFCWHLKQKCVNSSKTNISCIKKWIFIT